MSGGGFGVWRGGGGKFSYRIVGLVGEYLGFLGVFGVCLVGVYLVGGGLGGRVFRLVRVFCFRYFYIFRFSLRVCLNRRFFGLKY